MYSLLMLLLAHVCSIFITRTLDDFNWKYEFCAFLDMPKPNDPVREFEGVLGTRACCSFCEHEIRANSSKRKQHLVIHCKKCPESVKARFRGIVSKQSIATPTQKLGLQFRPQTFSSDRLMIGPLLLLFPATPRITWALILMMIVALAAPLDDCVCHT